MTEYEGRVVKGKSRITSKIIRSILIVELISLISIVAIFRLIFWPRMVNNTIVTAQHIHNEISLATGNQIKNLSDAAFAIVNSLSLRQIFTEYNAAPGAVNYNKIQLRLHELVSNTDNIRSVLVMDDKNRRYTSIIDIKDEDRRIVDNIIANYNHQQIDQLQYTAVYKLNTNPISYSICNIYRKNIKFKTYTFFFFYKIDHIISAADSLRSDTIDDYAFIAADGRILHSNGIPESFLEHADFPLLSQGVYHTGDGYYFTNNIEGLSWILLSFLSNQRISEIILPIFNLALLSFLIFFLVSILVLPLVLSRIIAPLNILNSVMKSVMANNSMDVRADIHTDDEIGDLSEVFNNMMEHIRTYTHEKIEYELAQNKMKYNLLVAQIDMHFIGNTMSIINSLSRKKRTAEIIKVNSALVRILHDCLRVTADKITDTVEHELDILNQYLIIEQYRYENDVKIKFEIPKALYSFEIPKNLLQPIVENSFRHGLYDEDSGKISGDIFLRIYTGDNCLRIDIRDSGKGVDEDKLSRLNAPFSTEMSTAIRGKRIGLRNIYMRLQLIYGTGFRLEYFSQPGFTVRIQLPLKSEGVRLV